MKKKMEILIITLIFMIMGTLTINAADATANLNLDKAQIYRGDTFSVTLNVACEEGINGLQAKFSYDENRLELTESTIIDTSKWVNLGESPNFEVIHNSSETETSADIVKLTFKVKDNAEFGTAKITASDIVVDSDAGTNSTKQVGTKETQVTIVEKPAEGSGEQEPEPEKPTEGSKEPEPEKTLTSIEVSNEPTKKSYKVGEQFNKAGMKIVAKYSDGTSSEITNYTIENGDKLEEKQTSIKISYTEGSITKTVEQKITVEKDNTKSGEGMPKTGIPSIIGVIIVVAVLGIVSLVKYTKYKEI